MTKYRTMITAPASPQYGVWEEFADDDLEKRFGEAKGKEQLQLHRTNPDVICQVYRNGAWRDYSLASIPAWQRASELEVETLQRQADGLRGLPRLRYSGQAEALVDALGALKQAEDAVRDQKGRVADAEKALKEANAQADAIDRQVAAKGRDLDKRLATFDAATSPTETREPVAV